MRQNARVHSFGSKFDGNNLILFRAVTAITGGGGGVVRAVEVVVVERHGDLPVGLVLHDKLLGE
jgi:hypothetical protein